MEKNDKLCKVLDMIDHPERYTDEMIHELLLDPECADYYNAISITKSGIEAKKASSECDEEMTNAEWKRFEQKNYPKRQPAHRFTWHRIAAIFIGCAVLSALAVASWNILAPKDVTGIAKTSALKTPAHNANKLATDSATRTDSLATAQIRTFDNARLADIIDEVAKYYGANVQYEDKSVMELRLQLSWDKSAGVEGFISTLNYFDKVHAEYDNNTIILK